MRAGQILGGIEEVRQNWDLLLRSLPDFRAEVVRVAADGDAAFIEQDWSGTRLDGTKMHSRGVNVFGIREGQITWGRVYMETVKRTASISMSGCDVWRRAPRPADLLVDDCSLHAFHTTTCRLPPRVSVV